METKELWEIFVPTKRRLEGTPIKTKFHKIWDSKVREITGGLTIYPPVKGQWVNPHDGELFEERMIPVKIACTSEQIEQIMKMTMKYYDQLAIFAYRISDCVKVMKRDEVL